MSGIHDCVKDIFNSTKNFAKVQNFIKVDTDFLFLAKLRLHVARKGPERKKLFKL